MASPEKTLPKMSDFPEGTEFYIKEFDVPLACIPSEGWFNWYGGGPRKYDPKNLSGYGVNCWVAESFEEWVRIVNESM